METSRNPFVSVTRRRYFTVLQFDGVPRLMFVKTFNNFQIQERVAVRNTNNRCNRYAYVLMNNNVVHDLFDERM